MILCVFVFYAVLNFMGWGLSLHIVCVCVCFSALKILNSDRLPYCHCFLFPAFHSPAARIFHPFWHPFDIFFFSLWFKKKMCVCYFECLLFTLNSCAMIIISFWMSKNVFFKQWLSVTSKIISNDSFI